jgi:acyl-coenzyme A thioesterase PaaI-like protein
MLVSAWTIVASPSSSSALSRPTTTTATTPRAVVALNSAVQHGHRRHRIPVSSTTTGTTTTSTTLCEAARWNRNDAKRADTATTTTTTTLPVRQGTSYVQMKLPDRAKVPSHAIFGALLQTNLIEQYDVYQHQVVDTMPPAVSQRPPKESDDSASTLQEGQDIVTAVVKLGYGLDGHPGVVHGGILALIIDDVLGLGNLALSTMPTHHGGDYTRQSAMVEYAVTANLNVNYTAPVPAGSTLLVTATLVQQQQPTRHDVVPPQPHPHPRKLHWLVRVTSLDETVTYCLASSLYIIPRAT